MENELKNCLILIFNQNCWNNSKTIEKLTRKKNTQGPQKKFGGPHAARGPHFGHVCTRPWLLAIRNFVRMQKAKEKLKEKYLGYY
jgi:hypothetical protein